ncbi:hypothetical protein WJ966_02205 [Achromobacter xylosoxidans]
MDPLTVPCPGVGWVAPSAGAPFGMVGGGADGSPLDGPGAALGGMGAGAGAGLPDSCAPCPAPPVAGSAVTRVATGRPTAMPKASASACRRWPRYE